MERPGGSVRDHHAGCTADAGRSESSGPDATADDWRPRRGPCAEEPDRLLRRVPLEHVPGIAVGAASDLDVRGGGRRRTVVRDGHQLQLDRCLLQQGVGGEDRDDECAEDACTARCAAGEGEGGRYHADRAVQRRRDRRSAVPASAADGRLWFGRRGQQLGLRQAGCDHQHGRERESDRALATVDQGRLFQPGCQRRAVPRDDEQL